MLVVNVVLVYLGKKLFKNMKKMKQRKEDEKKSGIYVIENTITKKVYVGKSINIYIRIYIPMYITIFLYFYNSSYFR
jgi:hypothetical protein